MIASRLGLAIATGIAVVLGLAVLFTAGGDRTPPSHALAPAAFDTAKLARLAWSRPNEPDIVLERAGTSWRWTRPVADVPANAATIDAVVAALRGGRWHRRTARANAPGTATFGASLTATAANRTLRLAFADPVPSTDQTWIAIDDHAYLVDAWIARALSPSALALRETRPLADVGSATTIVVERRDAFALRIEGTPRRLVRPVPLYLAPSGVLALERALASLEIIALPHKPGHATTTISIDAPRVVTLEHRTDAGCPPDTVGTGGTFGPGCVSAAQWQAVEAALQALRGPAPALADPRPLPFQPAQLTLADGTILDLAKRPRIGDHAADPAHLAELLAVLTSPYPVVAMDPASPPVATLVATSGTSTTLTLELLPDGRLRRQGEPVALVLGAGAFAVLTRPSAQLRDPTPWTEEPMTIRAITIDGTTYTRGAVVGEWSHGTSPTTAAVGAELEALARMLAKPGATIAPRAPAKILHDLSLEVAAPGAAPITHAMRIGPRCIAVADAQPLALEPTLCAAIARVASR